MPMRSKNTIFDAALLRCGRSITGGDQVLREAMDANYDEIVRCAFEEGDGVHSFGRTRVTLTSRAEGHSGYDDAYVVPADCIQIVEVYLAEVSCSDLLEPWEFSGEDRSILINAGQRTVEARYVKEGLEHTWSGAFALGVQRRLEAVIKDALEETEESALKEQEADYKFLIAGVKSSKNRSQQRVWKRGGGRLIRARRTPGPTYSVD